VDALDLSIQQGEVFGLLGPNGAGKTTAIQMLLGLTAPSDGRLEVFGLDPSRHPQEVRTMTGVVLQGSALDPYLTGRKNLRIYADLFPIPSGAKAARTEEMLRWAGLEGAADRLVRTYSGGMKRCLDLAIATLHHPKLLVLDEPTLGLDIHTRRQLWDLIVQMREGGTTVLLTTHYLEEANGLCDHVGIMNLGKLVALGTPEALRQDVVGDLHRLTVKVRSLPDVQALALPVPAEASPGQLSFRAAPEKLWRTLAVLQTCCGERILEVTYTQPSLDDVFLELTRVEDGQPEPVPAD